MFTVNNSRGLPFPLAEADEILLAVVNHICRRYRVDVIILPQFTVMMGDKHGRLKWPDRHGDGAELGMAIWSPRVFRRGCVMFVLNQLLQKPNVEMLAREIEQR